MRRIIISDRVATPDSIVAAFGVVMSDGSPFLNCGVLLGDDDGTGDRAVVADGATARASYAAANRATPRGDLTAPMPRAADAAPAAPA